MQTNHWSEFDFQQLHSGAGKNTLMILNLKILIHNPNMTQGAAGISPPNSKVAARRNRAWANCLKRWAECTREKKSHNINISPWIIFQVTVSGSSFESTICPSSWVFVAELFGILVLLVGREMCHSKLRVSTSITISPNAVIQIWYEKTYNIPNQYPKKFDSKDSFFLTISPEKLWPCHCESSSRWHVWRHSGLPVNSLYKSKSPCFPHNHSHHQQINFRYDIQIHK